MIRHLCVAYYPEHCAEERWPRDVALMREHGIDSVRVLEFAWSRLERADGRWDLGWVHRAMRLFEENGLGVMLCTPSASPPAWLTRAHPETLNVSQNGQRAVHGYRRNYCPTSRRYRDFCNRIATKLQGEFGGYGNVLGWQVDNELGFNRCFCAECETAFRAGVRERYEGSLEALNAAWGGAFWSRDVWDWGELTLPRAHHRAPAEKLAYDQFYSDQITGFMAEQVAALRAAGAAAPISTNLMGDFDQIDYWKLTAPLDFVGWDNYFDNFTLAGNSLAHHLMRSLKGGAPYWTHENGVNSSAPFLQTAPGFNNVHALSALAHGEAGHTYFRWDSCPFGQEQDLQGMVDWGGRPRAKLREVKELRASLDALAEVDLPALRSRVAIVYSWQNYWGTANYYGRSYYDANSYKSYWPEVESFYQALFDLGLPCDCVPPGADLAGYDLVLTPGLCLVTDDDLAWMRAYVERGGVLFTGRKTFAKTMTGSYRASDHPDRLGDVFGLRVVESQGSEDANDLAVRGAADARPLRRFNLAPAGDAGTLPSTTTEGWFEVLELHGARPLYHYVDGYFPGQPAATAHGFGRGQAFYLGARVGREAMRELMRLATTAAGFTNTYEVPPGAQVVQRGNLAFWTNHTGEPLVIPIRDGAQILAGAGSDEPGRVTLPAYGFSVAQTFAPTSAPKTSPSHAAPPLPPPHPDRLPDGVVNRLDLTRAG